MVAFVVSWTGKYQRNDHKQLFYNESMKMIKVKITKIQLYYCMKQIQSIRKNRSGACVFQPYESGALFAPSACALDGP